MLQHSYSSDFFFSTAHLLSRSWQLLGEEDSWLSLLPVCLPASRSLLHALISPLQPRKLEKNIPAGQNITGDVPLWLAAPGAPLYPGGGEILLAKPIPSPGSVGPISFHAKVLSHYLLVIALPVVQNLQK